MVKLVNIFLRNSIPMTLVLPEQRAQELLSRFNLDKGDGIGIEIGATLDNGQYMFNWKDVMAMVVVTASQAVGQQSPAPYFGRKSGM